MRLFVGLEIADDVKDVLEHVTLRLRAKEDGLRWSTPDQWHVTLAFLGEVGDEARGRLVRELAEVRLPLVSLRLDGLGVFERVGILHAQVEITSELLRLHEVVTAAVKRLGLEVEDRPYRAHVTLARSRNREGRTAIERLGRTSVQQRLNERWQATEFLLYESRLSPKGSEYLVRERFRLE